MTLPAEQIAEKNRLDTTGASLWLLALTLADSSVRRFARYTADIVCGGYTYKAHYFEIKGMRTSIDGSLPRVVVKLASAGRPLGSAVETIEGNTVVLTCVNSKLLSSDYSERERTYRVTGFDEDERFYRITLGAPGLLSRRSPLHELTPECDHVFGDLYCGYGGPLPTCDGSVEQCVERDNITEYGGELGLQDRGRIIV